MSGSTTEADILNNIPGLGDDAADTTDDTSTGDTSTQGREADTSRARDDDGTGEGSRENTAQQRKLPETPVLRRHDGLVERQSQTDPRHRDLVDPVTGEVVARGGIERRVFEQSQRATRENQQLKQELTRYKTQAESLQGAQTLGTQLGLNVEQQTMALRLMADFQRNPVQTIEAIIAELQSKGHHLPFLQQGGTGGLDMQAIQRMLDERLKPIQEPFMRQRQMEEAQARAKQDLDNFIAHVPNAQHNLDIIAELLNRDQGLDLPTAYTRMVEWAIDQGLDPRQPLREQLAARQNQPALEARQPRPLPNGRMMSSATAAPVDQRRAFEATDRWDDIIESSMREAGFRR